MAKKPQITPLRDSSWLAGFHYDEKSRLLTMHKKDGGTLPHPDVPAEKVAALENALSPGIYYNSKIRNQHPPVGK